MAAGSQYSFTCHQLGMYVYNIYGYVYCCDVDVLQGGSECALPQIYDSMNPFQVKVHSTSSLAETLGRINLWRQL